MMGGITAALLNLLRSRRSRGGRRRLERVGLGLSRLADRTNGSKER